MANIVKALAIVWTTKLVNLRVAGSTWALTAFFLVKWLKAGSEQSKIRASNAKKTGVVRARMGLVDAGRLETVLNTA